MLEDSLRAARRELDKYRSDVPTDEAVSIMSSITGLRIHLLRPHEIAPALSHAKAELQSGRVRDTPSHVAQEVRAASTERWEALSQEARAMVATLWTPKTEADMVISSLDPVQPKDKILSLIKSILVQKERLNLGRP